MQLLIHDPDRWFWFQQKIQKIIFLSYMFIHAYPIILEMQRKRVLLLTCTHFELCGPRIRHIVASSSPTYAMDLELNRLHM